MTRAELIRTLRLPAHARLCALLGLPTHIHQEGDGSHEKFERVFQAIDEHDDKWISPEDWERYFVAHVDPAGFIDGGAERGKDDDTEAAARDAHVHADPAAARDVRVHTNLAGHVDGGADGGEDDDAKAAARNVRAHADPAAARDARTRADPAAAAEAKAKAKAETKAAALCKLRDDYTRQFPNSKLNPFGKPEPVPVAHVDPAGHADGGAQGGKDDDAEAAARDARARADPAGHVDGGAERGADDNAETAARDAGRVYLGAVARESSVLDESLVKLRALWPVVNVAARGSDDEAPATRPPPLLRNRFHGFFGGDPDCPLLSEVGTLEMTWFVRIGCLNHYE